MNSEKSNNSGNGHFKVIKCLLIRLGELEEKIAASNQIAFISINKKSYEKIYFTVNRAIIFNSL